MVKGGAALLLALCLATAVLPEGAHAFVRVFGTKFAGERRDRRKKGGREREEEEAAAPVHLLHRAPPPLRPANQRGERSAPMQPC